MLKSLSPTRRSRALSISAVILLLLALTSCGLLTPVGGEQKPLSAETLRELNPQPPVLPKPVSPRPRPNYQIPSGGPKAQAVLPLSESVDRVAMKALILVAIVDDDYMSLQYDTNQHAAEAFLDQIGMPYDVLEATTQSLTADVLVDSNGDGRYSAIILSSEGLVYESAPGANDWLSALNDTEWDLLHQYEREFAVRQLTLDTWPGTGVEDYGLTAQTAAAVPPGYVATLTAAGQDLFPYIATTAEIPITDTYLYGSVLKPGSNAVPILMGSDGRIIGVTTTSADGRERLALTYAQAPYLLHSQLLGYGLIDWVTRGVFFGQKRYHLDADVDDWFSATGHWDMATSTIIDDGYDISDRDAYSLREQQSAMQLTYPLAADFKWTMAYNGERALPNTPLSCSYATPEDESLVALTAMTKCVANDFNWVNHTWSHEYMDYVVGYDGNLTYEEILAQIGQNQTLAAALPLGPGFSPLSLVTGDISGLGWYAPGGPDTGPKVDFGLEDSNPLFLQAADQLGIKYIASNMSTPSHEPDCSGCGTYHPLNASLGTDIFLVPRYPTNVFATVTTDVEALHAYNSVYGVNGSDPNHFDHDVTYSEYLRKETDIAMSHILSGSPYPHYFHTPNLNEYAPGKSLLTDWATSVLADYSSYMNVPLVSLRWDDFGARIEQITSHHGAAPTGMWDRRAGTLQVSSAAGGTVLMTGVSLQGGDDVTYGGELQSARDVAAGGSFSVSAPTVTLPAAKFTQTITFDMELPEYRLTTAFGFELFASATSGLPVEFVGAGECFVGDDGWLYQLGTPGMCTITATQAGNSSYYEAPPVSRSFPIVLPTYPLSVTVTGDGSVAGGNGDEIACPGTCSAELDYGSEHELTATPGDGSVFVGWTGSVTSTSATIQVSMTEARSVTATFGDKQSQTITFEALADRMANAAPFNVSASASSGLTVTFAASGVCSVTGTEVTLSGDLGTCTVTASQAGDAQYLPAPDVERSFQVTPTLYDLAVSVVGSGSVSGMTSGTCSGSCSEQLAEGAAVSLTATAADGYRFSGWSGAQASSDATIAFTLNAATSLTATFVEKDTQTIDFASLSDRLNDVLNFEVAASASSGLTVSFAATGVCLVTGTTVTLTGALGECTVTASQAGNEQYLPATPVERSFTVSDATFTLSVAVDGEGSVAGNGIDCPGTCSADVATGTVATLTATAAPGWRFSHWTGDSTATTPAINLTMNAAASVTAHFVALQGQTITFGALSDLTTEAPAFTVTATASSGLPVSFAATGVCSVTGDLVTLSGAVGDCTITASQAGNIDYLPAVDVARTFSVSVLMQNQTITFAALSDRLNTASPFNVSASASSGLPVSFTATGVCSVTGSTVTLNGQAGTCTVTANQAGNGQYLPATSVARSFQVTMATFELSVTKAGAGYGVIVSSPGNIGCSGTCSATFDHGTLVTLVPVPVLGSTFTGWSGACSGQGACVVNMTAAKTVTASFARSGTP